MCCEFSVVFFFIIYGVNRFGAGEVEQDKNQNQIPHGNNPIEIDKENEARMEKFPFALKEYKDFSY